jgi:uncharacterized membrane protein
MDAAEREHAELLAVYDDAVDNIRSFQDRQTSVTNYAVLVYACLIGYVATMRPRGNIVAFVAAAATVAAGGALVWLVSLQNAVKRARWVVVLARAKFKQTIQDLIKEAGLAGDRNAIERKLNLLPLFIAIVVFGWALTIAWLGQLR